MIKATVLFTFLVLGAGTASAQFNDGLDDAVHERLTGFSDGRRVPCRGATCRNDPRGVYPQSTRPGAGARTPSMSGGFPQR